MNPRNDHTTASPPSPGLYLAPTGSDEVWVLRYWLERDYQTWLYRDPAVGIAQLATIARDRWHTVAGRTPAGGPDPNPEQAPEQDHAAVNLYFASLTDGAREGYWLYRQDIDQRTLLGAPPRYVLVGPGGDLTCVCGNDASTHGFATCDQLGDILDQDEDATWDGRHYRCLTCDLVIARPTGQILGRPGQLAAAAAATPGTR
ncbi:MAG TPA: hypothetical protein VJT31_26750 [Rugosimonospora sp.]|nr:hypothetical protein [Rugosimonospora sp.]